MLSDTQRAALAVRLRRSPERAGAGIPRRPAGLTDLPASFGQEQLWFLDQFAPGQPTYNVPYALALSGPLDVAALGRALDGLAARHEALRTRLVSRSGRLVQLIDPPAAAPVELVDLSALTPEQRQAQLGEFIGREAMRPFELSAGPLLRTWLLRLAAAEHVLLAVVHHAVFDGWSAGVFVAELAALYGQESSGEPSGLAELPVQFADYALWDRSRLQGPALARLADYWSSTLAGLATVQFPTDRPRPVLDSFAGGLAQHMTDRELLDGLQAVSRAAGTTLFVTLMAALQALLHRYTGQTDLVVGTATACRSRSELASMVGFLVNMLPIRADLSGDPTFAELLGRIQEATVGAYAHQDLPFGKLVEALGVDRDPSRAPVFQIALTYAERTAAPVRRAGVDFVLTDLIVGTEAAKFDLAILAESRPDGLWFECSYKTALFEAATVARLLGHLEVLLRAAAADPSARLSALPVLTGAELRQELAVWNDTAAPFVPACVHQCFEGQAERTPRAVAAQYGDERRSYGELNREANQIARRLRDLGVGPEVLVGVCMQTGLRRLAAVLGIWKAGGGYVPLDPALPAGRLAYLMGDTGMSVILTDEASASRLPDVSGPTVVGREADWTAISGLDSANLTGAEAQGAAGGGVSPANVAYVIYTSGSTGQPKGVVVEHRQAANFLRGMVERWAIGPASVVLQFGAFTFDASVMDMFVPLLGGGQVILAPAQTLHSPPRLARLMRERGVTFALLPPAVLSLLRDEQFPALEVLLTGGEELNAEVARHWIRPGLRFANAYGPTEAAVIATDQELDPTMVPPPIGRPTRPGYQAYVLDARLQPVPVGVLGELHIGGASVARGYLRQPELTDERFVPDPFRADPGGRLYKTGDLVRRRPDGAIAFVGRIDDQVQIRGLRVELGEIEAVLAAHPGVAQAVATVVTDAAGDKQLAGYLRAEPGEPLPGAGQLREHLAKILPAALIPAYLVAVDAFPLSGSGKIDRSALPAPDEPQGGNAYVAPATLIETMMADLYAQLLHRQHVGATDNFFDVGGSSLQAMRLITMMASELQVDVGAAAVFLAPTPRQLAALLCDQHGFVDTDLDALEGARDDAC
jgi:amino acid adenylation domain-containing protein